jgi:hypothetical protein
MVRNLLQSAVDNQAAVIATACPMCQVNLEVYQQQVNLEFGTNFSIPVMYFTQLIGLALGISHKKLGIGKEFVSMAPTPMPVDQVWIAPKNDIKEYILWTRKMRKKKLAYTFAIVVQTLLAS